MPPEIEIVGLGGSLARKSTSLSAMREALAGAEQAGASTRGFDLKSLDLPMYDPDAEPTPQVMELVEAVENCHGMVWSSPLYHGSISGSFKNAIDWLQVLAERGVPYLNGKVIGMVSTAGGVQGLQAVNTMEFIVRALRGYSVPLVIPIPRASQAFSGGELTDESIGEQLRKLGAEVVRASRQMSHTGQCDYSGVDLQEED